MKTPTLTIKQERQRKMMLVLPLIVLPFVTLLFWSLGGGKGNSADAQSLVHKGFNKNIPDAQLKDNHALNKMGYYSQAAADSEKLKQQMKSDPYYRNKPDSDTTTLHFPMPAAPSKMDGYANQVHASKLIGANPNPAADESRAYQKLAELQNTLHKTPEDPQPASPALADPANSSPFKSQVMPEDPQLKQMNSLLEKILDIQHPERLQNSGIRDTTTSISKFKAIPAVIDGRQKITEGSVVRMKLLDTVTLGGQLLNKGQLIYGKGLLYNQRLTLNLKIIRIGRMILPVDLTVFDMTDGLEGINVPEAITGDAVKDGAANGVQGMEFMSMDPSMTAQLAGAGMNTAKSPFSKKVKRVKATLKDGHELLLRNNTGQRPL